MKQNFKRVCSLVLIFAMVLGMLPATASAASVGLGTAVADAVINSAKTTVKTAVSYDAEAEEIRITQPTMSTDFIWWMPGDGQPTMTMVSTKGTTYRFNLTVSDDGKELIGHVTGKVMQKVIRDWKDDAKITNLTAVYRTLTKPGDVFKHLADVLEGEETVSGYYYTGTISEDGKTMVMTAPTIEGFSLMNWNLGESPRVRLYVGTQKEGTAYTYSMPASVSEDGKSLIVSLIDPYTGADLLKDYVIFDIYSLNSVIAAYEERIEYTVEIENGTDSVNSIAYAGDTLTLPETYAGEAPENTLFIGWTDGTLIYPAGANLTVDRNLKLVPYFADLPVVPEEYIATFKTPEGYLVAVLTSADGEVTAPVCPELKGYEFLNWGELDGTTVNAGDTVVLTADAEFTAVVEAISYDITYGGDNATCTGADSATYGTVVTFTVESEEGYELEYVKAAAADGTPVAVGSNGDGSYFFTMPAADVAVTAVTAEIVNVYVVRFLVDGALYDIQWVEEDNAPEYPAEPAMTGYNFSGWMDESGMLWVDTMPTVTEDMTLTATFERASYRVEIAAEENMTVELEGGELEQDGAGRELRSLTTKATAYFGYGETVTFTVEAEEGYEDYNVAAFANGPDGMAIPVPVTKYDDEGVSVYMFTMPAGDVTVLVQSAPVENTVKFVVEGDLYAFESVKTDDYPVAPADPEKEGYTFVGWEGPDGTVYAPDELPAVKGDVTYNAVFEVNSYVVTYYRNEEANESEVKCYITIPGDNFNPAGDDQYVEFFNDDAADESMRDKYPVDPQPYGTVITLAEPTLAGYKFIGWMDEAGYMHPSGAKYTVLGDQMLTAIWTENEEEKFVIRFYGVDGDLYELLMVTPGDAITVPEYLGGETGATYNWIDDTSVPTLTVEAGDKFVPQSDMTFRANLVAKETYQVIVNVTPDEVKNEVTAPAADFAAGEVVTVDISVPEGYVLKSVSAMGAGLEPIVDSLAAAGENAYLYSFTMIDNDVIVDVEFEKVPTGSTVVKFVNNGDLYDYVLVEKGTNGTAPAEEPTLAGHTFIEWRSENGFVAAGGSFAVPADAADEIVYTAVYEADKYVVHYNMNGGLDATGADYADVDPAYYDQTITLAGEAFKDGYVFIGWREDATGMVYGAGATYVVKGNTSFTAVWEAAEFVVRFVDPDTGIIYGYEPVSEGQQVMAPAAPVVAGKTFSHWENKDNASDKVFASSMTPNILADTTYYAVYEVSTHNIAVVTDQCSVALNVTGSVAVGTAVQFTVTANEGCAVASVVLTYVDGLSPVVRELHPDANGVYTFVMPDADVTITAKAVQNVFSVFTNSDANTQITTASNKAEADSVVTFTVDVNDGYTVKEVYVLGASGKPVAVTLVDGAYTFVMPAEDVTITATSVKAEFSVTYLDSDNTLLGIVPVASGEYAEAPVASKDGYTFDHWEILPLTDPAKTFNPETDEVKADLVVRAVYVGNTFTVSAGLVENVYALNAECTVSSGNTNSSNLLLNALNAEAGKTVTFVVAANYDWAITGVAIVGVDGSKTVIEPTLRLKETVDGINFYTVTFTMPAEDVKIDVYTVAKLFRVDVEENIPAAGEYTINGFYSNNLLVAQGETVTIDIMPIPGYEVVDVVGTFFDGVSEVSLVDCTLNADKTQFTFPMVAKDVHVEIIYAPIGYNIDIQTSNFETYKPKSDVNPAVVVESLDPELTSQGRIELLPLELVDYTNDAGQIYKIPADGVAVVGDRIKFQVIEYTGYDLDYVTVTYDNGECTCPLTLKDGIYYFDMPADAVVITAVFKAETYTVTKDAASEAHGQVELNGKIENSISADYKEVVTVDVTPDDGYQVSKIYYVLDNTSVMDFDEASYTNTTVMADVLDTAHSISFHMPASDVKVYVEYVAIDYTVNVVTEEATVTGYTTPSNVGDQVNFHVEANYGYTIKKVYVVNDTTGARVDRFTDDINGTYGADYYFTMPASSVTIHVETVKDIYNVEYRDNGDLIGGENIPYLETANVTDFTPLVAEGKPGYHFVGWTSAQTETPVTVPSNDNADFVIVRDTTIVAAYEKDEIDVHFLPTVNGTVTELSTGNTAEYVLDTTVFGDTVKFTAEPDEGYAVGTVRVYTVNSDGYVLDLYCTVSGNEYSFVIPATFKADIHDVQAADVNVSVTFVKDTFTLTKADDCGTDGTIAVNGAVSTQTSFHYEYQDDVTITATPNAGYYVVSICAENGFKKYVVEGSKPAVDTPAGEPLTLSFQMPACDLTYTVVYAKCDYSITYVADPAEGAVTSAPKDIAQIDDVVTVTVTPKEGYELAELTVTYAGGEKSCVLTQISENVYTFTMPAEAVTVTAIFTEITYTVNLTVNGEGEAMLNGYYAVNVPANYLDTVAVTVMPADGWKLTSIVVNEGAVTVNEAVKAEGGVYTFTMPASDVNVVVTLEKVVYDMTTYALNFYESGHGTITLDPADTANVGDCVVITADPDDGYRVANVVVLDAKGYAVPVSKVNGDAGYVETWRFTMPASNVSVYVTFEVYGSSYYTDVRTDFWFFDAVTFVSDRGYFFGVGDGLFAPYKNMDRAMFVTVLGRMNGVDKDAAYTASFTDVQDGDYFAPYVAWAAENGIVLGRDDTTFDPYADITREEMAAIMYRYCEYIGMDMTIQHEFFMDRYTDKDDISDWAVTYVEWAVGIGLMRGMSANTIDPLDYATRAQVAQVIKNLCDKVLYI